MKRWVPHSSAVDLHPALSDKAARLSLRLREPQLLQKTEQSQLPPRIEGKSPHWNLIGKLLSLHDLTKVARALLRAGSAVEALDDTSRQGVLERQRISGPGPESDGDSDGAN